MKNTTLITAENGTVLVTFIEKIKSQTLQGETALLESGIVYITHGSTGSGSTGSFNPTTDAWYNYKFNNIKRETSYFFLNEFIEGHRDRIPIGTVF